MKNVLLILLVMSSVGQTFGSEKIDEVIVLKAMIPVLQNDLLRYCEKEYIDFLNNDYGIRCDYNEPLIRVSYNDNSQNKVIVPITFIPFKYFLDNSSKQHNNIGSFKQPDAELLSCSNQCKEETNRFRIELVTDFGNKTPQELLSEFRKKPQCAVGSSVDKKDNRLSWGDPYEVEKELCDVGIIYQLEGQSNWETIKLPNLTMSRFRHKYVQGIKGYFGEEVEEEIRQYEKAMQTALFYSRIKKLFGVSIVAIIAYILYQKFYNTAELI